MNPSVEVYLLDDSGRILSSSTALADVKLQAVDIRPIERYLATDGKQFTMGEDPKGLHKEKVFTATPFLMQGRRRGYIYVILGGEEYDSALQFIQQNYILRLGVRTIGLSLIAASVIGLVSIAFLTRRLRRMTRAVISFGRGDLSQRIPIVSEDEIGVTARAFNQMADTIQRQVVELASVDALRRELIANVSHDLRTPLSSIQGYVETVILKNGLLTPDERSRHLHTILESTVKLSTLVEELFELSKLDARQSLPAEESFSLAELVQDVAQGLQPQAEKKNIRVDTEFERDLPFVRADIGMIERVLRNLIENAVKFTPEKGHVIVGISRAGTRLKVQVADSGCGIPEGERPDIFDRYYRSSRNRASTDGAGLGLAIVKKILLLHGEEITAGGDEHRGAVFTFMLPVDQGEDAGRYR